MIALQILCALGMLASAWGLLQAFARPATAQAQPLVGVFDDANRQTPETFEVMLADLESRGIQAVMMSNGCTDGIDALLTVADRHTLDIYVSPGACELNERWWSGAEPETLEAARATIQPLVRRLQYHARLAGYNLVDEPGVQQAERIRLAIQAIHEIDSRPTFPVLIGTDRVQTIGEHAQPDVLVVDVYPYPACDGCSADHFDMGAFGYWGMAPQTYYDTVTDWRPAGMPLWVIAQTHGVDWARLRTPTPEQIRVQFDLAVANGADAVFWFVYSSQQGWVGLKDNPTLLDAVTGLVAAQPPPGVPQWRPNFSHDVSTWWAGHPMNPANGHYEITRPATIITAQAPNLQAAIDACPAAGCSIWLPNGTYADYEIHQRSNIHFLGESRDGVHIGSGYIVGCAVAEDYTTWDQRLQNPNDAEAYACIDNRHGNYSWSNLTIPTWEGIPTYDTLNHRLVGAGIFLRATRDVLIDNVTVKSHSGVAGRLFSPYIGGNGLLDNVWIRDTRIEAGGQASSVYLDGCSGCGIVGTDLGSQVSSAFVLLHTNNDLTQDWDRDGVLEKPEKREIHYFALSHSVMGHTNGYGIAAQGQNVVMENNTVTAFVAWPFSIGRVYPDAPNPYDHVDAVVRGNVIQQAFSFFNYDLERECSPTTEFCPRIGQYSVTDNRMVDGSRLRETITFDESLNTSHTPWAMQGPNVESGNTIGGSTPPTQTPVPSTSTPTATSTPVPLTATSTPVPPTSTPEPTATAQPLVEPCTVRVLIGEVEEWARELYCPVTATPTLEPTATQTPLPTATATPTTEVDMAFPTTGIIEAFSGGDQNPYSTTLMTGEYNARIQSGVLRAIATNYFGFTTTASFAGNVEAYVTLPVIPSTTNDDVYLRMLDSSNNGYRVVIVRLAGADSWAIQRMDAGSGTTIASGTDEMSAGMSIGLERNAGQITAYRKTAAGAWTQILTVADATHASDVFIGLDAFGRTTPAPTIDDFGGGQVVGGATAFPHHYYQQMRR